MVILLHWTKMHGIYKAAVPLIKFKHCLGTLYIAVAVSTVVSPLPTLAICDPCDPSIYGPITNKSSLSAGVRGFAYHYDIR